MALLKPSLIYRPFISSIILYTLARLISKIPAICLTVMSLFKQSTINCLRVLCFSSNINCVLFISDCIPLSLLRTIVLWSVINLSPLLSLHLYLQLCNQVYYQYILYENFLFALLFCLGFRQ